MLILFSLFTYLVATQVNIIVSTLANFIVRAIGPLLLLVSENSERNAKIPQNITHWTYLEVYYFSTTTVGENQEEK